MYSAVYTVSSGVDRFFGMGKCDSPRRMGPGAVYASDKRGFVLDGRRLLEAELIVQLSRQIGS